jgi:transposase
MTGDCHVRFWEKLGVKFPWFTRPPHRMLEGDEKSNWYLWGFCDGRNSYFEIHGTRSGDVASSLLAKANCQALMSDVFSGYARAVREANKLRSGDKQIINVYCNAHARRKFVEAEEGYPKEAAFYIQSYKEIYKIESEVKVLNEAAKCEARQTMGTYFIGMRERCAEDIKNVSLKSSLAKAIGYFTGNFEGLTECINRPEIPLDNNLQERQLRRPVIGRKTWYGTHSKKGARTAAALFTVTQSCRLCKANVREYLSAVVKSLHNGDPPFTPWEFSLRKEVQADPSSFLHHENLPPQT